MDLCAECTSLKFPYHRGDILDKCQNIYSQQRRKLTVALSWRRHCQDAHAQRTTWCKGD
jgi:hypothetical protein